MEKSSNTLTPKKRKTPKTKHSLHQCSSVESKGIEKDTLIDRRGRKQKQIWSGKEFDLPSNVSPSIPSLRSSPKIEFIRMKLVKQFNKKFFKVILNQSGFVPPIMTFERWLFRAKFLEQQDNTIEERDPVLPSHRYIDEVLVSDLVRAFIDEDKARDLSLQISIECEHFVDEIISSCEKSKINDEVKVISHKHSLDVIYCKKLLKITHVHYDKVKTLFFSYGISDEIKDKDDDYKLKEFHKSLFVMLARYHGIQGHGYQAACAEKVFETLTQYFGVTMECFASPLNCYYNHYCSAFLDTDWCFGAVDNFFNFFPSEGSFECNPPFVPAIMLATANHIFDILKSSDNPLTFIIILPGWLDDPAIQLLEKSNFLSAYYQISKNEHGFCDGAQHQRMDRFRESPFDTFVFVIQNKAGKIKYPATKEAEMAIRKSMATAIPSEAMKQRRLRDGRGFGDADGAGGVYKGKPKNRKRPKNLQKSPSSKKQKLSK